MRLRSWNWSFNTSIWKLRISTGYMTTVSCKLKYMSYQNHNPSPQSTVIYFALSSQWYDGDILRQSTPRVDAGRFFSVKESEVFRSNFNTWTFRVVLWKFQGDFEFPSLCAELLPRTLRQPLYKQFCIWNCTWPLLAEYLYHWSRVRILSVCSLSEVKIFPNCCFFVG